MTDDVLARLLELQAGDLPVQGGRTLAYVYDSGLPEVDRIGREAVATYAASNGLDPTSFPSLLAMENELVGFACNLLEAPDTAVGSRPLDPAYAATAARPTSSTSARPES